MVTWGFTRSPDDHQITRALHQGKAFTLPNDVFDRLYGYQCEGVAWMAKLMSRQHGGVA